MTDPSPKSITSAVAAATALALALALASCGPPAAPPVAPMPDGPEVPYADLDYQPGGTFFHEGKPFTGIATGEHPNGQASKRYGVLDGKLHGVIREWADNGNLTVETHFDSGQRHGKNTYWTPDGKLLKTQVYDHDTVIEETWHQGEGH